jgi:hypothetical protein
LEARDQWCAGSMEQSGVDARIGAWIAHVPLRDAVNDRQRYLMSRVSVAEKATAADQAWSASWACCNAVATDIHAPIGNHTFRATGITAYLANGGVLEHAQAMAAHESPRKTKLYDRTEERLTQDEAGEDQTMIVSDGI